MNGEQLLGILMGAVWILNWSLAGIVYLAAPHRSANRWLAVVLYVEGMSLGAFGLMNLGVGGSGSLPGLAAVHMVAWIPVAALYMAFINRALPSPLAQAAGRPSVAFALVVYSLLMIGLFFTTDRGLWLWDPPRLWALAFTVLAVTGVYAFLATLQALRGSTGVRRAQIRAYLLAFAARDGFFVAALIALPGFWFSAPLVGTPWLAWNIALAIAMLVFACLLAYGILKTQLFDIDLKVKWTLRRSTLVTALAAVFFIVKEAIEAMVPVEGILPGIAAAAAVGAVVYPVWRLTGRLTDRLMPHVDDSAGYFEVRKDVIYRTQLEAALADGEVSTKERVLLSRLRESLGLDPTSADRMERETLAALGLTED